MESEQGLASLEQQARDSMDLYMRNLVLIQAAKANEQKEVELDDGRTYAVEVLKPAYEKAVKLLNQEIPAKRQVKQQARQQSVGFAQQLLPKMFEQGSEEANIALQYIQANPKLRELEDSPRLLAFAIKGLQAWQKEQKAAKPADATAAAKKTTPKAPNLGEGGSAPVRSSRDSDAPVAKKQAAEALNRLKSSGSTSDLANFFKASR